VGGTYSVLANNSVYDCFAQKKLKQNGKLLVGDTVEVVSENNGFVITKIYKRNNELLRPSVANVEQLVIVLSSVPAPDFMLIDKLIIYASVNQISTLLVINKCDLFDEEFIKTVKDQYQTIVDNIVVLSAKQHTNIKALKEHLQNKFSVFAGQSAVGKSTILNTLGFDLETGELSKKVERGKHTTRHSEIYVLNNTTFLADTPGFSLLELFLVEPDKLHEYYTDFDPFKQNCKYRACNHVQMLERECAVKQAVSQNKLNKQRYERYVAHYNEVKKRWDKRYD
jgi:ribosome biogenesis GTPase